MIRIYIVLEAPQTNNDTSIHAAKPAPMQIFASREQPEPDRDKN
jgi:hypothetical protein